MSAKSPLATPSFCQAGVSSETIPSSTPQAHSSHPPAQKNLIAEAHPTQTKTPERSSTRPSTSTTATTKKRSSHHQIDMRTEMMESPPPTKKRKLTPEEGSLNMDPGMDMLMGEEIHRSTQASAN
jgi:hypothetical protein